MLSMWLAVGIDGSYLTWGTHLSSSDVGVNGVQSILLH